MTLEDLRKWADSSELKGLDKSSDWNPINNRTRAYLLPCLKYHGAEFNKKINQFSFFAAGLYDVNKMRKYNDTLTLLFNIKNSPINFDIPFLVDEYFFGELIYGRLHALVIKVPEQFKHSIKYFEKGQYSKMYKNPLDIFGVPSKKKSFFNDIRNTCLQVCNQDSDYRDSINTLLSSEFGGELIKKDQELDSIMNPVQEIFNYNL